MRDLETELKKFFRMDMRGTPICLLHHNPNCKVCTNVYVALVKRQIFRKVR